VESVGFGDDAMLPGYFVGTHPIEAAGGVPVKAMVRGISTGFEATSGLELKRGRPLTHVHDAEILVSEALARACWPGEDPIGKIMRPAGGAHGDELKGWIVIGVVADMRISLRAAPSLVFYCDEGWYPGTISQFVVKVSAADWEALGGKIRRELYAYDPEIVVQGITSLDGLRDSQLYIEHMTEAVLQVLAGTAAMLTFIGIFSVLAYTVDRRMGEFGVRLAFGATPRHLMRLVIRRGVALAAIGVALGLGTALALSRSLGSVLYGISANDPGVMLAVSIAMLLTAALGCIVPAYRASKADVVRLLRSE
jgi:putative ABC transport system permease protein